MSGDERDPRPEGPSSTDTPEWSSLGDEWAEVRPPPPTLDRYELLFELGRGGMGVVYNARDTLLDREVALKLTRADMREHPQIRERMLREARACAQLDHPNIIDIYDIGQDEGQVWFAMRRLPGPTLSGRILREGPLPPEEAARVTAQLARALQHAHSRGLIHRDVKPGNVIFDGERPVLTDFGLVKFDGSDPLTRTDQLLGTAAYMAPELLEQGPQSSGPASDQYALGVLLYECLCGIRPYSGSTPVELLNAMLSGASTRAEALGAPPGLARVCRRAMARSPQERFPDLGQLADALEAWAAGARPVGLREDRARALREQLRRNRRPMGVLALTIAAIVLALVGADRLRERQAERRAAQSLEATLSRSAELRASGRVEEAEALFRAFTEDERSQGTRALAQAWLRRGAELLEAGELDRAQDAAAEAFVAARHATEQQQALAALARVAWAKGALGQLVQVLELMEEAHGPLDPEGELRDVLAAARAAQRRLSEAAALSAPPTRALLRQLSATTSTPHRGLWAAPLRGAGRRRLALLDEVFERTLLVEAELPLPVVDSVALWGEPMPLESEDRAPELLLWGSKLESARCVHLVAEEAGWSLAPTGECQHLITSARADLDGDGVSEDYLGYGRGLVRMSPDDARGWRLSEVDPVISASNSEVRALVAEDIDGDGDDELLVGSGGWESYDLRVLDRVGDTTALRDRLRLGDLDEVISLQVGGERLVAALVAAGQDTADVADTLVQSHPERGVYIVRWSARGLEPVAHLPVPHFELEVPHTPLPSRPWGLRLFAGDLDGDGDDELIVTTWGQHTTVLDPQEGRWVPLMLPQLFALAALDLDGDGDDELLASDRAHDAQVVVLGAGQDALPPWEPRRARPAPPPAGLSEAARLPWARSETLLSLDLEAAALRGFEQLALRSAGDRTEGLAWSRVAEIHEASERYDEALEAWRNAADTPELAPQAWEGAWRSARADHRLTEAIQAAEQRVALTAPPALLVEDLELLRRSRPLPTHELAFTSGLPAEVRVVAPGGPRWDARSHGLRLRGFGQVELLRVPLRREGDRIAVTVDLQVEDIDWSGFIEVELAPRGGEGVATVMSLNTYGGGDRLHVSLSCEPRVPEAEYIVLHPEQVFGGPLQARREQLIGVGEGSCEGRGADFFKRMTPPMHPPPEGPELDLIISTKSIVPGGLPAVEVLLERVTLEGLIPERVPEPPLVAAHAALALGQPRRALERLQGEQGREASLARAWAYAELDDARAARSALDDWLTQVPVEEHPAALSRLLLMAPLPLAEAVFNALGPGEALRLYVEALRLPGGYALSEPSRARAVLELLERYEPLEDAPVELSVRAEAL
ncbi:MAG: protein kinase, partial [Alphaproteobacteria bacterium]|nr:protein kinase [Alphaproteobacteria bacterium]